MLKHRKWEQNRLRKMYSIDSSSCSQQKLTNIFEIFYDARSLSNSVKPARNIVHPILHHSDPLCPRMKRLLWIIRAW